MFNFDGKKVVVTGGTQGIGRATALAFAEKGARVAICGRDMQLLNEMRELLWEQEHIIERVDLCNDMQLLQFCNRIKTEFQSLDAIVINPGRLGEFVSIEKLSPIDYDNIVNLNIKAPVYITKYLGPLLNANAAVTFVSSIGVVKGAPDSEIYNLSKAAIINLAKSLTANYALRNVRVNSVSPGGVDTDTNVMMNAGLSEREAAQRKKGADGVPLRRLAEPDEIAAPILFLSSQYASYITGADLVIDGGALCAC